jgi:hypothetical protein
MNVFVLCTGRCGSHTFAAACGRNITNYTTSHESGACRDARFLDDLTFRYPPNHIEVDNALALFCFLLDKQYGKDAYYVHLVREAPDCIGSLTKRKCCRRLCGLLFRDETGREYTPARQASLYYHVYNSILDGFMRAVKGITIHIESPESGFGEMWQAIGAEGDYDQAVKDLGNRLNRRRT